MFQVKFDFKIKLPSLACLASLRRQFRLSDIVFAFHVRRRNVQHLRKTQYHHYRLAPEALLHPQDARIESFNTLKINFTTSFFKI